MYLFTNSSQVLTKAKSSTFFLNFLLLNLNLNIPKDIAIVGFTDGPLFEYTKPSITSINQHGEYIGKLSAKILIDRIENNNRDIFIYLKI